MDQLLFILLFAVIAFLYSSVGHGGASGFIALMILLKVDLVFIKPTALILNILVASLATWQYYRSPFFKKALLLPFLYTSVPCAFIGSLIKIDQHYFKIILGICLLFAIFRILMKETSPRENSISNTPNFVFLSIGAIIGLISGMIGIGGGILLSPVLILAGWASLKEAAAISAPFILINSLAGLAGTGINGISLPHEIYFWVLAAAAGGFAGSYLGAHRLNLKVLKYFLSLVLLIAASKLFIS